MVKITYLLAILFFLLPISLTAQVSKSIKKDHGLQKQFTKGKDTTIYVVIVQQKDTLFFGGDQKFIFEEGRSRLTTSIQINNKLATIEYRNGSNQILNLKLAITEFQNDTIPVYHINDPAIISHFVKLKKINCIIQAVHVPDYVTARENAFFRNMLRKLFD